MATPRATRYRARHARPTALPRAVGLAGLATATTFTLLPAGAAGAQPELTQREVEARIAALDTRAGAAVEDFRQAEQRLAEVEQRAAAVTAQVAVEQARLDDVRTDMGQVVAAAYRRGSSDRLVSLVAGADPVTFLQRASTLDRVARSQADVLAEVATARHRVATQQDAADRELAALRDAEEQLAERRRAIEAALAEQQELLDGLQEAERARLQAAREAAAAAPVAARASRSSRVAAPAAPGQAPAAAPAPAASPTYDGPASGRAKVAIDEAYKHLGKPYKYGGNGPDSFDCSGFTSWVWRAAGVSLPRTSRDQYAQGRKVARADIQPGDLVYFGSPIHHVGMYVGDGQMINSPQSGGRVRVQAAFRSDFVGATRPGA